ncbi:MAG: dethiobiotin synthase [Pseudomonadota bacterium]
MKGYFITGTDTGVGKTMIAGALARALARSGRRVGVMKPFETGCTSRGDSLIPEDAVFLKEMSGCNEDIHRICPYRLRHPLAPLVAAAIEKVSIDIDRIKGIYLEMKKKYDVMLIEGAGGVMVPVAENLVTLDVIAMLNLPLLIVSRLSLGTINHTLLTVQQAQSRGIDVSGIILNQVSPVKGLAEETNPEVLRKFSGVPLLGQMPFIEEHKRKDADYLADCAAACMDFRLFS